jgi:uncharacterized protein (TIGR03083 family)
MSDIRRLFCAAADATAPLLLLAGRAQAARYDGPSALAEFSVRGLAGHLLRAMTSVEGYLDAAGPPAVPGAGVEPVTAAAYYATVLGSGPTDINDDLNRSVRQRGVEAAPGRAAELAAVWAATTDRLRSRLAAEPAGRFVSVYGGIVLTLDDYLLTRLVEVVVHGDDLAGSLGVEPPALDRDATGLVIATLVEVARIRHGDTAVVRALTRRERDTVGALRVL